MKSLFPLSTPARRLECCNGDLNSSLEAMGTAYVGLLERRHELLVLLHSFAASADDEVRTKVRRRYAELHEFVKGASNAPDAEVSAFFAKGMLMTIATAIDYPELIQMDHQSFTP